MEEVLKEGIAEEVVADTTVEKEEVEDYFNPFADIVEEKEEEVVEEKKEVDEKVVEKKEVVVNKTDDISIQYNADKQARTDVRKLVEGNPMFAEYADNIEELTSKAIVRGIKNPVEFAVRNLKSPKEWIDIGIKMATKDVGDAMRTKIGGASSSKSEAGEVDVWAKSTEDFNKMVNQVKSNQ